MLQTALTIGGHGFLTQLIYSNHHETVFHAAAKKDYSDVIVACVKALLLSPAPSLVGSCAKWLDVLSPEQQALVPKSLHDLNSVQATRLYSIDKDFDPEYMQIQLQDIFNLFNDKNKHGETAYDIAVRKNHEICATLLECFENCKDLDDLIKVIDCYEKLNSNYA